MLSFSHVRDYIGGKAGGKPQIFLPHIAFYQCMPEWFITYIHPCSCPFFTDGSKSGILPAHPYLSGYRVICPCRSCRSGKSIFYFRYGSYFSMTESETPPVYSTRYLPLSLSRATVKSSSLNCRKNCNRSCRFSKVVPAALMVIENFTRFHAFFPFLNSIPIR